MAIPPLQRRRGPVLNADINVTSLVDVAFTLLVIFIITAPIIQGGIEVELPRAQATPITTPDAVVITIEATGTIYVGDVPVESLDELRQVYPQVVQARGARMAHLKADRSVMWGRGIEVLDALKTLDVAEVGLVVEPETRR